MHLDQVELKIVSARKSIDYHARRQLEKADPFDKQMNDATAMLRTPRTKQAVVVSIRSLTAQLLQTQALFLRPSDTIG